MKDFGIGSWPARRARMSPGKPALVQDGQQVTYRELEELVDRAARGLAGRGIRRGERVAFLGRNSIELVVAMFATARLGAVFLPLNARLAPPELAWILGDSEPALLLWADGFEEAVGSTDVAGTGTPAVRITTAAGRGLDDVLDTGDEPLPEPEIGQDELFMIQYTSGTSGRPKGVQLTHGNITWNSYNLLVDIDLHADEVALVTAPLFHTAALNQVLLPTLLKGGTVLVEARFDPARVLELVERYGVTLLFGVTSMYQALARQPAWRTADLSTLRSALSGGAPIPVPLLEAWHDRGLTIIQGYGLTEASPGTTMLRAADADRKPGSAGTACFFTDVRVATADGDPVKPGETGEVLVRGPNVTPGYWRNQTATDGAFTPDGWLRTGDAAVVDEDGFLYIVDRVKDMYISGGENVYPAEVEQELYRHPDVLEAAVIGVPDRTWGEVGRAVVVRRPGSALGEAGLLSHLDGRLAGYKIPKSVVFVDELPHTPSGKLAKSKVREQYATPAEEGPR